MFKKIDTPSIRTPRNKGCKRKTVIDSRLYVWRIHRWLENKFSIANKCENLTCPRKSKKFEWSLKKNCKYRKNKNNFWMLCKSCHRLYDDTVDWRNKIGKTKFGKKRKCPWMIKRNKRKDIIRKMTDTLRKRYGKIIPKI